MKNPFSHWIPIRRLSVADLPDYGNFPAAYALRDSLTKNILKYGATKHMRQRIFMNFLCGWGGQGRQSTTQRVYSELYDNEMIDRVEIAWLRVESKIEAERMEWQLRQAYKDDHRGFRPPWDWRD
jgi:hypothetical protein